MTQRTREEIGKRKTENCNAICPPVYHTARRPGASQVSCTAVFIRWLGIEVSRESCTNSSGVNKQTAFDDFESEACCGRSAVQWRAPGETKEIRVRLRALFFHHETPHEARRQFVVLRPPEPSRQCELLLLGACRESLQAGHDVLVLLLKPRHRGCRHTQGCCWGGKRNSMSTLCFFIFFS